MRLVMIGSITAAVVTASVVFVQDVSAQECAACTEALGWYECEEGPMDWGYESCVSWTGHDPCDVAGECGPFVPGMVSLDGTLRSSPPTEAAGAEERFDCRGFVAGRSFSSESVNAVRRQTALLTL